MHTTGTSLPRAALLAAFLLTSTLLASGTALAGMSSSADTGPGVTVTATNLTELGTDIATSSDSAWVRAVVSWLAGYGIDVQGLLARVGIEPNPTPVGRSVGIEPNPSPGPRGIGIEPNPSPGPRGIGIAPLPSP